MTKDDKAARRKALVVGISDYANLQKLDFCKNDGREVYEVLSSLGYEISDENRLVGEAKGERVRDAIYDFFDDKRNNFDDTLLFYYSGHGVPGLNLPIYITSNYDHFMEAALKSRGKRPISDFCRWNEDLAGYAKADNINSKIYRHDYKPTPDNPLVYHLHGDIDYPHSIVLTERDYYDFVFNLNYNEFQISLPVIIRKAFRNLRSGLLLIGYDAADIGFHVISDSIIRSRVRSELKRDQKLMTFSPLPHSKNGDTARRYLRTYYLIRDVRVYWGSASSFCYELRDRLEKSDDLIN